MTTTEFSVPKLIDVTNKAIANLQADLDDHTQRVLRYKRLHLVAWQRDHLPEIRRVRDALTAALKTGKPITSHQNLRLSQHLYVEPKTTDYGFSSKVKDPVNGTRKQVQENIDWLKSVVTTLEAQTGDVISANQLRIVGVTKIGELFRTAAITQEPK